MSRYGPDSFLGIDIGSASIKAVLIIRGKNGRIKLVRSRVAEYSEADPGESLKSLIPELLQGEERLISVPVGVSISGRSAFIRLINIPSAPQKKLRRIVHYEIRQQVPFPIDEVVWDYQVLGRSGNQLHVLLAAVKKELIGSILAAVNKTGARLEFVDVSSLALYNCIRYFYQDIQKSLILDIGAKTTSVIVINSNKIWTRSLPIGGEEITAGIASALSISKEEAERRKKDVGEVLMLYYGNKAKTQEEQQDVALAATGVLTDLANEVTKTLNFYKLHYEVDISFVRVLLTGGVSKSENIDKFFENSLSVFTERVDYFNSLAISPEVELNHNEYLGPAIGLALRAAGHSELNLNLIPPEQARLNAFRKKRSFLVKAGVLLLGMLLLLNLLAVKRLNLYQRHSARLRAEIAAYESNRLPLEQISAEITFLKNGIEVMNSRINDQYLTEKVLAVLSETMPETIWLSQIDIDLPVRKVIVSGICDGGLREIGRFQDGLKKSGLLEEGELEQVGKDDSGQLAFSLIMPIVKGEKK